MAFEGLQDKLGQVFKKLKARGKLTEADVSYKVVKDFVAKVSERAVGEEVLASLTPAQQVVKIVNEELVALMGNGNSRLNIAPKPPTV
ncbi:MAG: signal recognition particle receptor subunit alpha, partial [Oscillospiraceae bacterium]|nr:signal recognition particle receptor subunit alpha [Oscillospiraceae bacterium]